MRVVKVYGPLAKFLGQRSFKFAVKSPAEAVRLLLANFPSLQGHMANHDYKISVGRLQLPIGDHPEYIHYPTASNEPIRIMPIVSGAGEGTGQILAGIGLVAAAILLAPVGGGFLGLGANALAGTFTLGASASAAIGAIGVGLALTGISTLLTPTTQLSTGVDSDFDPRKSYSFSGIQNVARQGVPVPIIYGEVLVGSIVVSAGIDVTTR
jgi:predicted phage tail protein